MSNMIDIYKKNMNDGKKYFREKLLKYYFQKITCQ